MGTCVPAKLRLKLLSPMTTSVAHGLQIVYRVDARVQKTDSACPPSRTLVGRAQVG